MNLSLEAVGILCGRGMSSATMGRRMVGTSTEADAVGPDKLASGESTQITLRVLNPTS